MSLSSALAPASRIGLRASRESVRAGLNARTALLSARPTHCQFVNLQRWLTYPDRDALTFLTAGSYAAVQCHVMANHRNFAHRFRAIPDERRAFDRGGNFAIFDEVSLAR